MHEVDFFETNLIKADFTGSGLRGTVFNQADLREADFRGAVDYVIDVRSSKLSKAKFSSPEALNLLYSLGIIIEG